MAVAVITAGGVFYAWIWDRCQTVWPVAIAHNVVNTVFDMGAAAVVATAGWNMAYVAGETGFATLGVCVIAAVVLLKRARVWREADADAGARPAVQAARGCVVSGHEGRGQGRQGACRRTSIPPSGSWPRRLALASHLTVDMSQLDPRLHDPNVLSAVATVAAAGALAWRRTRPRASYAVFVAGALVVSWDVPLHRLLSVLMLLSLYSLTTHARRRDALIGLGAGMASLRRPRPRRRTRPPHQGRAPRARPSRRGVGGGRRAADAA